MLKMKFSEQRNVLVEFLVTHMSYIWSFHSVNIEERLKVEWCFEEKVHVKSKIFQRKSNDYQRGKYDVDDSFILVWRNQLHSAPFESIWDMVDESFDLKWGNIENSYHESNDWANNEVRYEAYFLKDVVKLVLSLPTFHEPLERKTYQNDE